MFPGAVLDSYLLFFLPRGRNCDSSVRIRMLRCAQIKKQRGSQPGPKDRGPEATETKDKGDITMKKMTTMIAAFAAAMMMTVSAFAAGITADQAKDIALRQAGVDGNRVSFVNVKQDWDHGREEYEVEFYVGRTEYSVEIDKATGTVTDFDIDFD